MTVHADGVDTVAAVSDGTFEARWTLPEGVRADRGESQVRYTVTLDDGTVMADVVPLNR